MELCRKTPFCVISSYALDFDDTHFDLCILLQRYALWPHQIGADLPKDIPTAYAQSLRKTVMTAFNRSLLECSEISGAVARDILLDFREAQAFLLPPWTLFVHSNAIRCQA
jgi:hypothetical protein